MKNIDGVSYLVEDVKLGAGDWRVCRMTDKTYSNESFPTEEAALSALNKGEFSFYN